MLRIAVAGLCFVVLASPVTAQTTLTYDGKTPLSIQVQLGQPMHINVPAGITDIVTALPDATLIIILNKTHRHRLELYAQTPIVKGILHVNMVTGTTYILQIDTVDRATDLSMTVIDPLKPSPARAEAPPPPRQQAHAPAPDRLDPLRQVWWAQWGSPIPGVVRTPRQERLQAAPGQRVDLLAAYHGRGYYGFTYRVTNTSATQGGVWLYRLSDPFARLISAAIDEHEPQLQPGQHEEILLPGQSALLHIVYQTVRP